MCVCTCMCVRAGGGESLCIVSLNGNALRNKESHLRGRAGGV
jgi:hypothetical protein